MYVLIGAQNSTFNDFAGFEKKILALSFFFSLFRSLFVFFNNKIRDRDWFSAYLYVGHVIDVPSRGYQIRGI